MRIFIPGGWLAPFLAALCFVFLLIVGASRLPLISSARREVRLVAKVALPRPTPTPTPSPTPPPTPTPSPTQPPAPEPTVDPAIQAEADAQLAALIEIGLQGTRFPPIPYPFIAFWREREPAIMQTRELRTDRVAHAKTKAIEWPEAMPPQFRSLVLPGNIDTKVRYFRSDITQMDYVSEALIARADGKRGMVRWVVAVRFFADESQARADFIETVEDLKAGELDSAPVALELGTEATQAEISVGLLGQRERVFIVRLGTDVLEMQVSAGAPPEVHPRVIIESMRRLPTH